MEQIQHLPGCDLRHKPRQRCSTWKKLAVTPDAPPAPARTPEHRRSRATNRIVLGCLLLPLLSLLGACGTGVVLISSAVVTDWAGITDFFKSPPNLPGYAYPPKAKLLFETNGCGGNHPDLPPCRSYIFGSDIEWTVAREALVRELGSRGWLIDERRPEILSADAPDDSACVLYLPNEYKPGPFSSVQDIAERSKFAIMIDVYVDDCTPFTG